MPRGIVDSEKLSVANACKKKGHIARVCRSKTKGKSTRSTHRVSQEQSESEDDILLLHCTRTNATEPITVTVTANQADLEMEVDTGASASIISEAKLLTRNSGEVVYFH